MSQWQPRLRKQSVLRASVSVHKLTHVSIKLPVLSKPLPYASTFRLSIRSLFNTGWSVFYNVLMSDNSHEHIIIILLLQTEYIYPFVCTKYCCRIVAALVKICCDLLV